MAPPRLATRLATEIPGAGRPPIPVAGQRLIVTMARANATWGEERLANELRLKLGLTVSPRTVGRYLRRLRPSRGGQPSQRWATFVRNHAPAVLACDFFLTITARFRLLSVFVVLDVATDEANITHVTAIRCGDPFVVDASTPLDEVLEHMAAQHIGSALVTKNGRLAGIFTATDACRIYCEHLRRLFPSRSGEVA